MLIATIADFRKDIKRYLDSVTKNFKTLIINRRKDSGMFIISLEEDNSLTKRSINYLPGLMNKDLMLPLKIFQRANYFRRT
jgi:antitoxin YefM